MNEHPIDVLFVCVHNAGRSQMAEAYFNDLAQKRGLSLRASSAGTLGTGSLNQVAVRAMAEDGVDMSHHLPKRLTQSLADASGRVVSMGCGVDAEACPARFLLAEDWGLDDPAGQPMDVVRQIRDQIKARVTRLLDAMSHSN